MKDGNIIQDLYSHTYYSFCGEDKPEAVVEDAIAGSIELLGITAHNHGVDNARTNVFFFDSPELEDDYERTLERYFDHINLLKESTPGKLRYCTGLKFAL